MRKVFGLSVALLLMVGLLLPTISAAEEFAKVGTVGAQFMKIPVGARGVAMGSAFSAISDDATAMFWNPAGLVFIDKTAVSVEQINWIADISYNSFAAAYTLEDIGTFGVHGIFTDYGDDIVGTVVAANEDGYVETGNVDVSGYSFGISYARNLSDRFSVGGTVKFIGQSLGSNLMPDGSTKDNKVSGVAFDFGTIFYPGWESFRFGMSVRNFGVELQYENEAFEAPLTFTIGAAFDFLDMFQVDEQELLVSIDLQHPRDYTERVKMGLEYLLFNMFAFRAGYVTNHDVMGASLGLGFFYDLSGVGLRIDYAYSDTEYFDSVQRISAGFSF